MAVYFKSLKIEKFKSIKNATIHFNKELNVFTGKNNCGKTSILEAISLWLECFDKLLKQADGSSKHYDKGDYILGSHLVETIFFNEINSVRSPEPKDIFYNREARKQDIIKLEMTILFSESDSVTYNRDILTLAGNDLSLGTSEKEMKILFEISDLGGNYKIAFPEYKAFNFRLFNELFNHLKPSFNITYTPPVATIQEIERFASVPQVEKDIKSRASYNVLRNRLYSLMESRGDLYPKFNEDLNKILDGKFEFNQLTTRTNAVNTVIYIKEASTPNNVPKDLSLVGSGTLQIISILLDIYNPKEDYSLAVVLLDEPDSHIHRSVQKRLLEVLKSHSSKLPIQIFLTTHNESVIRDTQLENIFHIDGVRENNDIKCLAEYGNESLKTVLGAERFKGLFPSKKNMVITDLTDTRSLDFMNALESDILIFVEGKNDAYLIDKIIENNPYSRIEKKIAYWVAGSIDVIYKNIGGYKEVFSNIKNGKTLWDKTILFFDKDLLLDEDREGISSHFSKKLKLVNYCTLAYTQESILLTDLDILKRLLLKYFAKKEIVLDSINLKQSLEEAYTTLGNTLKDNIKDRCASDKQFDKEYASEYIEKFEMLGYKIPKDKRDRLALSEGYTKIINNKEYYKLSTKENVEAFLNNAIKSVTGDDKYALPPDYLKELVDLTDKDETLFYEEWKNIISCVEKKCSK